MGSKVHLVNHADGINVVVAEVEVAAEPALDLRAPADQLGPRVPP